MMAIQIRNKSACQWSLCRNSCGNIGQEEIHMQEEIFLQEFPWQWQSWGRTLLQQVRIRHRIGQEQGSEMGKTFEVLIFSRYKSSRPAKKRASVSWTWCIINKHITISTPPPRSSSSSSSSCSSSICFSDVHTLSLARTLRSWITWEEL